MAEEGESLAWQTASYYVKIKSTFVDVLGTLRAQDIAENPWTDIQEYLRTY